MSLKLAIGLGNTGIEYAGTRHNVGAMVIEQIAREVGAEFSYSKYCAARLAKIKVASTPVLLAVADGYMNLSGSGLAKILSFTKISIADVAVFYDDINLDAGRMKLSLGGSAGGHNGVADIMSKCGNAFARFRLGIGFKPDKRMDLADYVLGKLSEDDLAAIKLVDAKGALAIAVAKGFESAQNIYNRREA